MRCTWATISELDQKYHDEEWGVPGSLTLVKEKNCDNR